MNRRTFLKSSVAATTFLLARSSRSADEDKPKLTNAEVLSRAGERIEKHRKGDGVIVVRDGRGRTVRGATVKLEQVAHDFLFGCNFYMFNRCGSPDLEEQYRERFAALLNFATLGFYWSGYERERGKPSYDYTAQAVEWCRGRGITCKGHPLVWDHPASSPAWLPEDFKEIEALSHARVREIIERFKGGIEMWDVVNEATHLTDRANNTRMADFGRALGPVKYVADHLKVARTANPAATLLVNDYRTEPAYYTILDSLREDGKLLFDVVGIQSHMHGGPWPLHRVWNTCDTYARLGLPVHFTETTILSGTRKGPGENWSETTPEGEEKQAEQTAGFYTALFAHPAVQAITWWDFSDRGAWQRAPAGWLRNDMSPKPVYERLTSRIKGDWWTKTDGRTNSKGELAARAFHGAYRVTARLPNGRETTQEIHWQRSKANRHEIRVA